MIDERDHGLVVGQLEEARHDLGTALEREGALREELSALRDVVTDACQRLGHEGVGDGDDLIDAVGQLERFLEAKDLDAPVGDYSGVAAQLHRLIAWAHLGSVAYRDLLVDRGKPRAVVLSPALTFRLCQPLTAEDLYRLTTLPLDGVELDEGVRELLTGIAAVFNVEG